MSIKSYMRNGPQFEEGVAKMMQSMEGREGGGRNERSAEECRSDQAKTTGAFESGTEVFRDVRTKSWQSRIREVGMSAVGGGHAPVTFWTPDGSRHEGTSPRVNGEMLFVESKRMVPVGGHLTISLAPREGQSAGQDLSEGIVEWHCPLGDEFDNTGGFGVRIQRRWPKGPGSDLASRPKETA